MTSRSAEHVTTGAPALEIQDVVAGYGGGDVLHGVTMQVYEGGITCVVGPNGAGKSTLLGTISGLLNPRLGQVSLRGERLSGKTPRQVLDMGVVLVPQNHSLFREMTVRENIVLGGYILRQRGLADRRLASVLEMFPQVTEWLGKKAGSLSGGQQRLVEFARCLMLDPSLVILDEPSMGLSPKVLKSVFDAVRMMHAQGKTILLVEQNARAGLRLSTHGVVLENGRVRLAGSGHEVLHHPEIGALYLGGAVTDSSGTASPRPRPRTRRPRGSPPRTRRRCPPRPREPIPSLTARLRTARRERHRRPLIIDAHCHVIVPEMTARSVPEAWRPALRTEGGRRIVGFRGRELTSAVGEFSDVEVMLADAAGTGVGHLLLSPWINLVPVDAAPDEARLVCRVQNESLARLVAAYPGRLSAVGAVPVQDPELAARELAAPDGRARPARRGDPVQRGRPLSGRRLLPPVLGGGRRDRRAGLHPPVHPGLRDPRPGRLLPVELGRQPAGNRGHRGAHRGGGGAGALPAAADPAGSRRRRAAGAARAAAPRPRHPARGRGAPRARAPTCRCAGSTTTR